MRGLGGRQFCVDACAFRDRFRNERWRLYDAVCHLGRDVSQSGHPVVDDQGLGLSWFEALDDWRAACHREAQRPSVDGSIAWVRDNVRKCGAHRSQHLGVQRYLNG